MTSSLWIGVLLTLAVVAVIALLARFEPFGRPFRHAQEVSLVCPTLHLDCDCRIDQEVYSGHWETVRSCSAFPGRSDLPCDKVCLTRLKLGLPLARPAA